jgi:hypothetical protein
MKVSNSKKRNRNKRKSSNKKNNRMRTLLNKKHMTIMKNRQLLRRN